MSLIFKKKATRKKQKKRLKILYFCNLVGQLLVFGAMIILLFNFYPILQSTLNSLIALFEEVRASGGASPEMRLILIFGIFYVLAKGIELIMSMCSQAGNNFDKGYESVKEKFEGGKSNGRR